MYLEKSKRMKYRDNTRERVRSLLGLVFYGDLLTIQSFIYVYIMRPVDIKDTQGLTIVHSSLYQFVTAPRTVWVWWRISTTRWRKGTRAVRSWWATLRSPWWSTPETSPSCRWSFEHPEPHFKEQQFVCHCTCHWDRVTSLDKIVQTKTITVTEYDGSVSDHLCPLN